MCYFQYILKHKHPQSINEHWSGKPLKLSGKHEKQKTKNNQFEKTFNIIKQLNEIYGNKISSKTIINFEF